MRFVSKQGPPASLPIQGQVTKQTTVKWPILKSVLQSESRVHLLVSPQASYRSCLVLVVKVLRGRNITLGFFSDLGKYHVIDHSGKDFLTVRSSKLKLDFSIPRLTLSPYCRSLPVSRGPASLRLDLCSPK